MTVDQAVDSIIHWICCALTVCSLFVWLMRLAIQCAIATVRAVFAAVAALISLAEHKKIS